MTNWLLGRHPGAFSAAVSETPVTDMLAQYASSDFGIQIGSGAVGADQPWDHLAEDLERTPYSKIHLNKAPLLLLQAEQDLACPPGNSWVGYTSSRSLGAERGLARNP